MKQKKSSTSRRFVKVLFQPEDPGPDGMGETLWAEAVAPGRYRLHNTPFTVDGVSFGDIVFAEPIDGRLTVTGVSIGGGHSTFVVVGDEIAADYEIEHNWARLAALGCSRETASPREFAVDVPPGVDIEAVRRVLRIGRRARVWHFEETANGHFT